MSNELTILEDKLWTLLNREHFIFQQFHAQLRYRLPSPRNGYVFIQICSDDKSAIQHAEQYVLSYLQPKSTQSISYPPQFKQILCDDALLNRLMKEYLVHIDIEDTQQSHHLIFHSSSLTVLYLAIDDFQKAISNLSASDTSMVMDAQDALNSLTTSFSQQIKTMDEQDEVNQQQQQQQQQPIASEEENAATWRARQQPPLKKYFPGADSTPREAGLDEYVKKKKGNNNHRPHHQRAQAQADINDNELVHEMRLKLRDRTLRDVIIDGANVGRTYGDSEFSARGIKLAVDHFRSYGYSDSQIVVILPSHYLSKDPDHVLHDLIRRKIVHKAFQQKIDNKNVRFYDDRLVVDLAVVRGGVILSNDFYRDLLKDSGEAVCKTIKERLLCYRFVGDNLFLPNPVGEGGRSLDVFLSK